MTSWTIDGRPMLRTASAEAIAAGDPLGMASFPLVPFSNRIADARFDWAGETHAIAPNFAPEPHAIHGIGWTSDWTVQEARDDRAVLVLDHHGDARWPFAFAAEQQVELTADTLTVTLTARNLEAFDAPLACGHHPYFPAAGARLHFAAERRWPPDARMLPSEPVEIADRKVDFAVAERALDCAFSGWDGVASISWPDAALRIESEVDHAVVYTPAGAPHFCFEPVAHLPNALSVVVAPGATHRATLRLIAQAVSVGA
ncbi:aldose 1-epimerase [Sphingomonas sp. CCH9-H8]|uniref:aldose 1-epimerase n=1 Tax=Sphingomonas sp. CCH9-H8 TaxID=1768772 RepID=UPI001E3A2927|nr:MULTISPECIES: aldose 1-epimerase [unclassified Sphingomonas]